MEENSLHLDRLKSDIIQQQLKTHPFLIIYGPRKCGKSTLIRHIASDYPEAVYLDLAHHGDLKKLEEPEWYLMHQQEKFLCIDNADRKPELHALIRKLRKNRNTSGHILLLESTRPGKQKPENQPVDEQIPAIHLSPLLWEEVSQHVSLQTYLERGGYPQSLLQPDTVTSILWRDAYITTLLEQDIQRLKRVSFTSIRRLWQMLAHENGEVIKLTSTGNSLGVSHTTVRNYLTLLHRSFMITMLQPFIFTTRKRLVKSPKIYIADTGIALTLLGIQDFNQAVGHPAFASLWASLVLNNIQGKFSGYSLTYYRTSNGAEADIVMQKSGRLIVIICKTAMTPTLSRSNTAAIAELVPVHTFIVAPVDHGFRIRTGITVVSLPELLNELETLLTILDVLPPPGDATMATDHE